MKRDVKEWFEIIRESNDDKLAKRLLYDLIAYHHYPHEKHKREDEQLVLALITAIRLDQMRKEVP